MLALPCLADDFCPLLHQPQATYALPPKTAKDILTTLSKTAKFNPDSFPLHEDRDKYLKKRGTAAQRCDEFQYIFYNPDFIEDIQNKSASYWPKYFVVAHEVAHHFNNDPNEHHPMQESLADKAAAAWLTRMGASAKDLERAIKAFVVNETQIQDYKGKCDRVADVIEAYNDVANEYIANGADKPFYRVEKCAAVPVAKARAPAVIPPGLYTTKVFLPKEPFQRRDIQNAGKPPEDLPSDFDRDVAGMCAVASLPEQTRLTWSNIGVCALME